MRIPLNTTPLHASYSLAQGAAQAAAGQQHYPQSTLYVVATPIGNLADITLRALHVLGLVDAIACEDTRHTQAMLRVYGITKPLLAAHEHNEREAAQLIITRLRAGERVAYVSDAGTPAVSDPGARLAADVRAAGLRVLPLPGASSVTALLSVAGIADDTGAYIFQGFLSTKAKERESQVATLSTEPRAVVLLEAPHRIEALATALAALGERSVTLGRELTKQFEDIATVPAQTITAWLAADPHRTQGEFAIVIHPRAVEAAQHTQGQRVLQLLLAELPTKTAVKLAADITGEPRNTLYELALSLKSDK